MGFFSKLFSEPQKEQEPERIYFDSPFGRFIYCENNGISPGYEGDISDWYPESDEAADLASFFIADSPDLPESAPAYQLLLKYVTDRDRTDYDVKKTAAEYFLSRPGFTEEGKSLEELISTMWLEGIYVEKPGEISFSMEGEFIYASDTVLTPRTDGTKEIFFIDDCYILGGDDLRHTETI